MAEKWKLFSEALYHLVWWLETTFLEALLPPSSGFKSVV